MTRSEAYAEGFHEGRRWAEEDIRNSVRVDPDDLRGEPDVAWPSGSDLSRANGLGTLRGYRDTWARWDAGTLTWAQLDHAPLRAN